MKGLYIDDSYIVDDLYERLPLMKINGFSINTPIEFDFVQNAKNAAFSKNYDLIVVDFGAVEFKNVREYVAQQAELGNMILFVAMNFSELKSPMDVAGWFNLYEEDGYGECTGFLTYGNVLTYKTITRLRYLVKWF